MQNDGSLLIKNADMLVTMDGQKREITNGGLYCKQGVIEQVGDSATLPQHASTIFDASGYIILPGLINTHHHMFQNLTRAVPGGQDGTLFEWLTSLYPIWAHMGAEELYISAKFAMMELLLSGCTTTSDHCYIFPNDSTLDNTIQAATEIGMRFHATRGSMSIGQSKGGLPPDMLTEDEDAILADSLRVIDTFHDAKEGAMLQVALAPCSPFSVSRDLMINTAHLARQKGVMLHTHLAENDEDLQYSQEKFNQTPTQYAASCGWLGEDVWHAHCVKLDEAAMDVFAQTQTSIAHCPCSNMRLGSGIAPLTAMRQRNIAVGLGVDGSASNDSAHMLCEARQALLLQRVLQGASAFSARDALEVATLGGARVLNRPDLGQLAPNKQADFIAIKTKQPALSGNFDLVAALLLCAPLNPEYVWIKGKKIVSEYQLTQINAMQLLNKHDALSTRLASLTL